MPFLSEEEHLFSFSSGNYVTASNGLIMTGIVGPKQKWEEEEADVEGEHKERYGRMDGWPGPPAGGKNGDMVMSSRSVCMHAPQVFLSLSIRLIPLAWNIFEIIQISFRKDFLATL